MVYKEAAWIFGGFPWVYVIKIKNEVAEVCLDFPTHLAPSFSLRAPVATFNAPMGGDPLPLDLSSMGKGQVFSSMGQKEDELNRRYDVQNYQNHILKQWTIAKEMLQRSRRDNYLIDPEWTTQPHQQSTLEKYLPQTRG
ncbi:hypothetical protein Tco_0953144 [Tanacetum coccineum]|uniref:Uncharacterized protein n=1 Tax=Tanacetum coccineum TaxID=301880 RepID=A0ABQ5E3V3_9ASTR